MVAFSLLLRESISPLSLLFCKCHEMADPLLLDQPHKFIALVIGLRRRSQEGSYVVSSPELAPRAWQTSQGNQEACHTENANYYRNASKPNFRKAANGISNTLHLLVPTLRFLLSTHYTHYAPFSFFVILIATVINLIAKLPAMHQVRLFGVNQKLEGTTD